MDFITIGGEERPFRCSFNVIKKYGKEKANSTKLADIGEAISNVDMEHIPWLAFECLKDGAKKQGEKVNFSLSDVLDWFDDSGMELIEVVLLKIGEAIGGKSKAPIQAEPN